MENPSDILKRKMGDSEIIDNNDNFKNIGEESIEQKRIEYPCGSNFAEWLLNIGKRFKLSMNDIDTESDFWKIDIGDNEFGCDWKHLDLIDIEHASDCLKQVGFKINAKESKEFFDLELIKLKEKSEKKKLKSNFVTFDLGELLIVHK